MDTSSGEVTTASASRHLNGSATNGEARVGEDDFAGFLRYAAEVEKERKLSLRAFTELAEIWRITQALRECGGNRSAAARALGIGRRTLYAKMEKLGITPSWNVWDQRS